jgi:hypothetical protein
MNPIAPTELQVQLMSYVGTTLFAVQHFERALGNCLSYFFTRNQAVSVEEFLRLDEAHRKDTLGALALKLREHFALVSDFEERLRKLVENRNRFVHRLFHESGFDLETEEGCAAIFEFLTGLNDEAGILYDMLQGAGAAAMQADGISLPDNFLHCLTHSSPFSGPLQNIVKPPAKGRRT